VVVVTENPRIPATGVVLDAEVVVPHRPQGTVVFALSSGSGHRDPDNRYIATRLGSAGLASVTTDLLTLAEEQRDVREGRLKFDIGLLTGRVEAVLEWVSADERLKGLDVGLFGTDTGTAAALCAAARHSSIRTVVSDDGRPDLAGDCLRDVRQPTLLIVRCGDPVIIEYNRQAMELLSSDARLEIVSGVQHLFFVETSTLERIAHLTRDWFSAHLGPARNGR
jgi:dienelactone hydrolase